MKVKHWAGYGCVEATCVARYADYIEIIVRGNHEQGLLPRYFDKRDWERWLGKRFRVGSFDRVNTHEWWSDIEHTDKLRVIFIKEA